jgi:cardiolipin synthase
MTRPPEQLCDLVMRLLDSLAVERVRQALVSGELHATSTAAIRSVIAGGDARLEALVHELQTLWAVSFARFDGPAFSVVLEAAAGGVQLERKLSPKTEIVWTGPRVEGSYVRATREVVREIACGAERELVLMGYWLAARSDGDGVVEELIALLSEAVQRGIEVALVLDSRERDDGGSNKTILLDAWPCAVPLPRLLTWRLPASDPHLKLHAKVIVADATDALITSANLTRYAMDKNMEMGIRVVGDPARRIHGHLRLLEDQGTLEHF